ncbi:MAG: hypothetical protein A3F82_01890 [Deltaproteobacteria bacterium RIFCSPLOWO2_12_FULL_44_12]|nr:MAG: hypothetical protein A2712_03065 [Deltaproteobacteria bacterium RIFCSPHIGHO2_01_FULL_43_49]OGQ16175.1 MAG: hypothetical protein A3D22_01035 [Deltaproteobacteria bacterium RIFCSPHIGHO2_02_FULL_44_53]OGQ29136.1 MAG: hypothetical protein A3D98_04820 [Deltaproteobacteria bacterium RIFCSPHIGHO2_12_FULL_44_21]OGQ32692.1 MAG: hypothetical protein A2979_08965 [Deltaproteobacteria bacterium RIFCSPLOWO2_01_FULL_45_74]OGQ41794.1 MAG: hypothetical protein A3I70_08750 [Deltaproteobacteria bacterium 
MNTPPTSLSIPPVAAGLQAQAEVTTAEATALEEAGGILGLDPPDRLSFEEQVTLDRLGQTLRPLDAKGLVPLTPSLRMVRPDIRDFLK